MQDSSNREWDERFVDQAWGEMRLLLDEELPVAGAGAARRLRGAMVLFFLLGLAVGGLGIRHFFESPALGYFPIPDRAVALQPDTAPASIDAPAVTEANELSLTAVNQPSPAGTAGRSNRAEVRTPSPSDPALAGGDPARQKAPLVREQLVREKTDAQPPVTEAPSSTAGLKTTIAANPPSAPTTLDMEPAPAVETIAQQETRRSPFDFDPIATLPSSSRNEALAAETVFQETMLLPPVSAVADARRLQWGAELGGNYDQNLGYFGGLQTHYRLGKRWGLQSGLQYGQMLTSLDNTRPLADLGLSMSEAQRDLSNGLNANPDQPGGAEKATAVDYYAVDIRMQQISAPLLATYRINRKWRAGLGANVHYLLGAKRPIQDPVNRNPSFNAAAVPTYDKQLTGLAANSNTIDPQLLRDWNLGAVLGVAFQPVERWSVHLRFQYGVFNWLEADRFYIAPTNLQLSAAYRLSK